MADEADEGKEAEKLRKLADEWRERLARPEVREAVAAGTLRVSPLVTNLLKAFPARVG